MSRGIIALEASIGILALLEESGITVDGTCSTVKLTKKEKEDAESAGLSAFTGDT